MRGLAFAEGEFYHLYNRGVDKRVVFTTSNEYQNFLAYLFLLNNSRPEPRSLTARTGVIEAKPRQSREPLVAIGAYCLMPNHFHLYATPLVENGISKFMHRIQTAYTMRFNKEHERSGALFQGTFKAELVGDDVYAKYLFSYIHLNPAKIIDPNWKERDSRDLMKLREFVRTYPYSSLKEYIHKKHVITNPSEFPEHFSTTRDVNEHIDFWLRLKNA